MERSVPSHEGQPLLGKVVMITGGGNNAGEVYALAAARAGAAVAVLDVDERGAGRVAAQIGDQGGSAIALGVDITDPEAVTGAVDVTLHELGALDSLINNAALYAGISWTHLDDLDLDEWDRVMSVNVKGTFICSRAAAAAMRARSGGTIVNISSTSALSGPTHLAHYAASKAAVLSLTRSLARAYGPAGVRVNALAPGLIWDKPSLDSIDGTEIGESAVRQQILGRRFVPEDFVGTLIYLATDLSAPLTGQTIVADGGRVLT
ncbi:MAG TPA: SDR family oxidoreductase [Acidimicrobiales bacterium]|nr:SDR family oxidoreductase [Acidimicrobiales bacterium]